ncbi:MAG: hypothetical protein LBH91_02380 [Prevotellaceae bacterium]|jgi:hypothetical protein|nr:hypothetical protein [Prevotellaceae bacterium]
MKKIKTFIIAVLLMGTAIAFAKEVYHYGFITSCGKTAYFSSNTPLSDESLIILLEVAEMDLCSD